MQSLNHSVAHAMTEARITTARHRAPEARHRPRPPGPVRRSAASAAVRVARRLDADAARRMSAV